MFSPDQWHAKVDSGFYPYKINQSLRFDDDSNTYLNRTPSSTTNQRTWTYSFWFKHGSRTSIFDFLLANSSGDKFFEFSLTGAQKFQVYYHDETLLVSTAIFRDPSSWYHIVLRHDTTQSTADHRLRIYVNGSELTDWDTNGRANLPQNFDGGINEASVAHSIGRNQIGNNDLDGYLAEVHFVDGSSLAPSSFGETKDSIWVPKEYSSSHGTNGFYLPFDDGSAIGDDESSNTNDWTANNFAATDVVEDSPTNNFCTLNPIDPYSGTISEGNLKYNNGASFRAARGTFQIPTSGKWYFEVLNTDATSGSSAIFAGVAHPSTNISVQPNNGSTTGFYGIYNDSSLGILSNGSQSSSTSNTISADSILQFAIDADNDKLYVGINNSYYSNASTTNGDPSAGSNPTESIDLSGYHPFVGAYSNTGILNTGQDPSFAGEITAGTATPSSGSGVFKYAPPSGFLALCSANLDTPAIIDGSEHFNTVLYTGTGSSNSVTGVGFQPDWVWGKRRDSTGNHWLNDAVRGATKGLHSDSTSAEYTDATVMNAFNSDGFTVVSHAISNASSATYVAWNWLASTAFSNDASATSVGTIDSEGQVNATAGFSIIKYTGTGSTDQQTISVGLSWSGKDKLVIIKNRDASTNWLVNSSLLAANKVLRLNTTDNDSQVNSSGYITYETFGFRTYNGSNILNLANDYIAYCFHSVEGYSKVGSYTGNGSTDGTFVYTGFRPAWIMQKKSNNTGHWHIWDSTRNTSNEVTRYLSADDSSAEATDGGLDIVSNGFKPRKTGSGLNASGDTYIYLAFASQPQKFSNAR